MTCIETLALLSFRRLSLHPMLLGVVGSQRSSVDRAQARGLGACPDLVADLDWEELGCVLGQAIERLWLSIELSIAREEVKPLLSSEDQKSVYALCESPLFAHLESEVAAPDRQQVWRELHSCRQKGLFGADIDGNRLCQLAGEEGPGADLASLQELEWQALWQLTSAAKDEESAALGFLFQLHSDQGDSLLVRLAVAFATHELRLRKTSPSEMTPSDTLPVELLSWLSRASGTLSALLDQLSAGLVSVAVHQGADVQGQIRNGLALAQAGDFARSILELTEIIHTHPESAPACIARGDAYRLSGQLALAGGDYTAALRIEPGNVSALLRRGQLQAMQGRNALAVADFSAAVHHEPRSALAYHHRGKAYADSGSWEAALADFGMAFDLDSTNPWTLHYRGDAHAALGNYDQAIADYSNALRLSPQATLSFIHRGDAYRRKGEFDRAIADYGSAVRLDPLDVRAYGRRGNVYQATGKYEQAQADFDRALALDPSSVELFRQRGRLYQIQGQFEKAIADFSAALHLDSDSFSVYHERGLVHWALGAIDRALADLDRALRINPKFVEGYDCRGQIYAEQDRLDVALADYSRALALDPDHTLAYVHRAQLYLRKGLVEEALADTDQALQLDPELSISHITRGTALAQKGNYDPAAESFTQALRLDPKNAQAYYYRGLARAKQKALTEALADLTESLRLEPGSGQAYAARAIVHELAGQDESAVTDLAAAARLDNRYAAAYCNQRGRVHARKGRYQSAAADYSLALLLEKDNANARTGLDQVLKVLESLPPGERDLVESLNGATEPKSAKPTSDVQRELPPRPNKGNLKEAVAKQEPRKKPASKAPGPRLSPATMPDLAGEPLPLPPDPIFPDTAVALLTDSDIELVPPRKSNDSPTSDSAPPAPAPKSPERVPVAPRTRPASAKPTSTVYALSGSPDKPKSPPPSPSQSAVANAPAKPTLSDEAREEAEARARQKAEQERRLKELEVRQEAEQRKRKEAWAAARRRDTRIEDQEEDGRSLLQRLAKPVLGAVAALLLSWVSYSAYGYFQTHRKEAPPLSATKVWQEYADDPESANRKYAHKRFSVIGKIVIESTGLRGTREVYFASPSDHTLRIHCQFLAPGELFEVPSGASTSAHLIIGEFEPYDKGPLLELSNAVYVGGATETAVLTNRATGVAYSNAGPFLYKDSLSSSNLNAQPVEKRLLQSLLVALIACPCNLSCKDVISDFCR